MLKVINLVEEEMSATVAATTKLNNELNNDSIEDTADVSSECSESYDSSDSTEAATVTILDDEQIANLLNEDSECIDKEYENTEHVLNIIELENLGECSIFNGIRCVAHTLQLAVLDTLKHNSIDKLLSKVRILVRKLRNQTYIYLIKKEQLKLPILECLTRWHSTFDMLERLQHLKSFIQNMAANDPELRKVENGNKIETESLNHTFSNKLVQCLRSRELNIMNNQVLLAAIFLDPRFNITLTEYQYILEDFLKQKESDNQCSSISSSTSSQQNSQNSLSTKMETLLKTYKLDKKRLSHKTNILEYWKTMKTKYPEIYQLAQIVFSVPATQMQYNT
ncbi:uncharacterized protein LOC111027772 [Myzus persicae]|uniref:uncharacterized protein LOC111027772 n=1 Tax=Myzus persicae TaxID=13164 RepID=UPI000B93447C|nr:uncharacterized protein LOC111027772 [Myzus persicae]